MNTKKQWEWRLGLIAAIWGILVLAILLFVPIYQCASSTGKPCGGTLLQIGIQPITIVVLAILFADLGGFAIATYLDSHGRGSYQSLLWGLIVLLVILTFLSIASIGLFLLPAVILTVSAAVLAGQSDNTNGQSTHA